VQYSLFVDVLALKRWHGRIDATDALIIGFIAGLNPHNPAVAQLMRGDYFRLSRDWLLGEIPILTCSADWIGRKLAALRDLGIIDLKTERAENAHHRTYGKLSKLYFSECEKAKKYADRFSSTEGLQSRSDGKLRGTTDPAPADQSPGDHSKNDQKKDAPPACGGGGAPSDNPSPPSELPTDRVMTPEEETEIASQTPWRREELEKRQRVLQINRALLGERDDDAPAREAAG
jgi:hypothetical protein